jgi:hypothetical protein
MWWMPANAALHNTVFSAVPIAFVKYGCAPAPATNNATPAAFAPPLQHQGIASQDAPLSAAQGSSPQKGEIFDNMLLCIRAETGLITQLQHGRLVRLSAHKTQFR